jgi:hypothetical protein
VPHRLQLTRLALSRGVLNGGFKQDTPGVYRRAFRALHVIESNAGIASAAGLRVTSLAAPAGAREPRGGG